ncbi:MAG: WecB/TagA/CpsF family glycosyltransferase [Oscillatoria sp. PMC 1076.18]|nr:WecB/TagA/CpsF family glycosyltransferase [Oscillatoria sp. PMC 1076.18]
MNQINLLNVKIDNLTLDCLLEKLKDGGVVYTPNVDHIIKLQKDPEFQQIYQTADFRVCDSQIVLWASRFLGQPIQEKISGSDLFPAFCEYYKSAPEVKVFLLGGPEGVAIKAQEKINTKAGRKMAVASHKPFFGFEKDEKECPKIIYIINNSGATVLAIGVGAPKQEKWIFKYKDQLKNIKTFLAIGATIEFEAGSKKRAPKWISEMGLEWLFRLVLEPKRLWRRYLVEDLPFLGLIIHQKLNLHLARIR